MRRGRSQIVRCIGLLLAMQFVLGIADVMLLAPVWLQLVHLAGADLFWIALVAGSLLVLSREPALSQR